MFKIAALDPCGYPDCKTKAGLPCSACHSLFCLEHVAVCNHECKHYNAHLRQVEFPLCPICGDSVPLRRGEKPDEKVDEHIQKGCPKPLNIYSQDAPTTFNPFSSSSSSSVDNLLFNSQPPPMPELIRHSSLSLRPAADTDIDLSMLGLDSDLMASVTPMDLSGNRMEPWMLDPPVALNDSLSSPGPSPPPTPSPTDIKETTTKKTRKKPSSTKKDAKKPARKRGRPRKHPRPVNPAPKRKRGRPPKKKPETIDKAQLQAQLLATMLQSMQTYKLVLKQGRASDPQLRGAPYLRQYVIWQLQGGLNAQSKDFIGGLVAYFLDAYQPKVTTASSSSTSSTMSAMTGQPQSTGNAPDMPDTGQEAKDVPRALRVPPGQRQLAQKLAKIVAGVTDSLMMNNFEIVVWSFYLERLCPYWCSLTDAAYQLCYLYLTAFSVKLNFTCVPQSSFIPYLDSLFGSFTALYALWLRSTDGIQLGVAPVDLNTRYILLSTRTQWPEYVV